MRTIVTKILVAVSLLTGGIAAADTGRDHRTETTQIADRQPGPAQVARRDDDRRFDGRRDDDRAPAPRFEKHRDRRGFVWITGQWTKVHHRWVWQPGHYERVRR